MEEEGGVVVGWEVGGVNSDAVAEGADEKDFVGVFVEGGRGGLLGLWGLRYGAVGAGC